MTCPTQPRILFLDIETKLIEVRAFGIRDQYLDIKQIKDIPASARGIHCVGLKWADFQALEPQLRIEAGKDPQPEIRIDAEPSTQYETVAAVLATAKNVGITKLAFENLPRGF